MVDRPEVGVELEVFEVGHLNDLSEEVESCQSHGEHTEVWEEHGNSSCISVGEGFRIIAVGDIGKKLKCGELGELVEPAKHAAEVPMAVIGVKFKIEMPQGVRGPNQLEHLL